MTQRLKALQKILSQHNIDAYLVTKDINIQYLTGFAASESWLLVTPSKAYYLTDFRYVLEARAGLPKGVVLKQYRKSFYETLSQLLLQSKSKCLGVDPNHLTHQQYLFLRKALPDSVKLDSRAGLVEALRVIKDPDEIQKTREALALHHQTYKWLKRTLKPGLTEREALLKLEAFVRKRNADFSFDPIIAGGPNSALPHAHVTDRKIKNNEPLLVDMGIHLNGYMSDLTRMFFFGRIPELVRQINDLVYDAQRKAIEKIKPGVRISEVDQAARKYLAKYRLAKYFGHALGHGVGLEIHEAPRLSQKNQEVLKEGMIVTIEPAVYLPHQFGIRIEDMALVTAKGVEVLSDNIY